MDQEGMMKRSVAYVAVTIVGAILIGVMMSGRKLVHHDEQRRTTEVSANNAPVPDTVYRRNGYGLALARCASRKGLDYSRAFDDIRRARAKSQDWSTCVAAAALNSCDNGAAWTALKEEDSSICPMLMDIVQSRRMEE